MHFTTAILTPLALLSHAFLSAASASEIIADMSITAPDLQAPWPGPMTNMARFSLRVHEEDNAASPEDASCGRYWDYRYFSPKDWENCTPPSYQWEFSNWSGYNNFGVSVKHVWDENNATGTFHHERTARGAVTGEGHCQQTAGYMNDCEWKAVKLAVYSDTVTVVA